MKKRIMGFDISTRAAHFAVCDGKGMKEWGALRDSAHFRELVENHNISHVFIEDVPYIQNQRITIMLAQAVGRVQQMVIDVGLEYHMFPVAEWKSLALGNGNANKAQIKAIVRAITKMPDGEVQDVYDAAGVCLAGASYLKVRRIEDSQKGNI